jgi:hypothetical protein
MARFNKLSGHSSRPGNARSKIIALKVGDKLRTLRPGGTKIVKIKVPPEYLAKVANQEPRPNSDDRGAKNAVIKPPGARHGLSVISISETGSPVHTGDVQVVLNSDLEQLNNASKLQLKTASEFPALRADPFMTLPEPPRLIQEMLLTPPHRHMNVTSNIEKHASFAPGWPSDSPRPSWHQLQLQLLEQLGLSADEQPFSELTQDIKSAWPQEPTSLRDVSSTPPSADALLSDNDSYTPLDRQMSMNTQPPLPAATPPAPAAEGRTQTLDPGAHGLSPFTSVQTDPDDFETPEEFKERLINLIGQMMFVSGETAEASAETTGMIEEIVRAQVIEMASARLPGFITISGHETGLQS